MRLQQRDANEIIFWIQHCGYFPRERNEAMLVLATAWQEADRRNNRTDHSEADTAEDIYLIQFSVNQNGELYRIKHLLSKGWKVLCHGIYQWRFECGAWNVAQSDTYTTRVP